MEYAPVLTFIGLLIFLAHLFVALFERTKVPDVLYLVFIGVVPGPISHVISPADPGLVGRVFAGIDLVVILLFLVIETPLARPPELVFPGYHKLPAIALDERRRTGREIF